MTNYLIIISLKNDARSYESETLKLYGIVRKSQLFAIGPGFKKVPLLLPNF
jgi:hypothetical protein